MSTEIEELYRDLYLEKPKKQENVARAIIPDTFIKTDIGEEWREKLNHDPKRIKEEFEEAFQRSKQSVYTPHTYYANSFLDQHVLEKVDNENIKNLEQFQNKNELQKKLQNKIKMLEKKRK